MFGVDDGVTDGRNDVMAKRRKGSHQEGPGGLDETGRRDERTRAKRAQRIRSEKKRRKQFNELISELGALLPDGQSRMDKPTVLQRTLHFFSSHHELNVEQETNEPPPPWKPAFLSNDNFTQLILEAMDCFVIVVMSSGEISFVSESVTSLLGYLPSELLRQNLFDFVPEHEQAELRCLFQADLSQVQEGPPEAPQGAW